MNKETVERCYNMKDIGVEIDHKLDWSEHIRTIVKKSNRLMRLIKRTLGYHAPNIVKKTVVHGSVYGQLCIIFIFLGGTLVQV